MKIVVEKFYDMGVKYVVIKGGNCLNVEEVIDFYYDGECFEIYVFFVVDVNNIGVGCIFVLSIVS